MQEMGMSNMPPMGEENNEMMMPGVKAEGEGDKRQDDMEGKEDEQERTEGDAEKGGEASGM